MAEPNWNSRQGSSLREYPWASAYGPRDRPLESFYIPALSCSIRYDRIAGFFSSYALAVAAQGVAKLVSNGGQMRLLVGESLSEADVMAMTRGASVQDRLSERFLSILRDPMALADRLVKERLEVLVWLVANNLLQIRVVIEAEPFTGQPVASRGYFHAKGGLLYDRLGDGIAFSGSINETATAWRYNYERFHVFKSWEEPAHFRDEADTFERLWQNSETGWLTVELPEAVQRELVRISPQEKPIEEPALGDAAEVTDRARWIARFLRDAPFLAEGGWRVGAETAAVRPFPHQRSVAYDVLDNFPCNRLLADEVGLGKTIEAGLILRSLLISGRVRRCLILVPRSLAKQWQEELRDRFLVQAPFFDGSRLVYFDEPQNRYESVPDEESAWEVSPVLMASAQLAKRDERAQSLLHSSKWDLIIVDEAHHARRRDFLDLNRYRPNNLLRLLERLKHRTRSLLLLTATPMQVHPIEVYDLLKLLGMPEPWQDDQQAFLTYFQQLREPYDAISWEILLPLLRAVIGMWGWNSEWSAKCSSALGKVQYHRLTSTIQDGSIREIGNLPAKSRPHLVEALSHHSPVRFLVSRYSRELLRDYHRRGLMEHIPERVPKPIWLEMDEEESRLYQALDRYISTYYRRYEEERRGLGFIMTVYRRRLTSSLYALQQSLMRHRRMLIGQWIERDYPGGLDNEDVEDADLNEDLAEQMYHLPSFAEEEIREIDRLLERLDRLGTEAKLNAVRNDLLESLNAWDQILVFTQYTDTMDFLRRELLPVFGATLGCYSGRGGERWNRDENRWVWLSKERLQSLFSHGEIKVLICTEAGGEGLNLQNCGVLFNYDMPWNPMKVEQRIGRVDRIGQLRRKVHINHYLYKNTVEAEVYDALGRRIGWFEAVVGGLQPILQQAQTAIQRAAMEAPEEREAVLRTEIERMEQEYERTKRQESPVSRWTPLSLCHAPNAPVTIADLEWIIRNQSPWQDYIDEIGDHLFMVEQEGETEYVATALNGSVIPKNMEGVGLWSYGNPLFERHIALPPPTSRADLVRRVTDSGSIAYSHYDGKDWQSIGTLNNLTRVIDRSDS